MTCDGRGDSRTAAAHWCHHLAHMVTVEATIWDTGASLWSGMHCLMVNGGDALFRPKQIGTSVRDRGGMG